MATTSQPLFTLLAVFTLLAATASARPCKTIFYFSATTTTTTYFPSNPNNPNFVLQIQSPPRRYITLIFTTTTTRLRHLRPSSHSSIMTSSISPLKFYSTVSTSFHRRSKDVSILGLLGALLFGIGCGALTGALLFVVWALCAPRSSFEYADFSSSDDDDDDDEVAAAKRKLGYVSIPSDDLKKPAAAKEMV